MTADTPPQGIQQPAMFTRWESSTRYYLVIVQRNLFGDLEVIRTWGGKRNRLGGQHTMPVASIAEASSMLADEARRRERRGYASAPVS